MNGVSSAPTTTSDGTLMFGSDFDHPGVVLGQHAARGLGQALGVAVRRGAGLGAAALAAGPRASSFSARLMEVAFQPARGSSFL